LVKQGENFESFSLGQYEGLDAVASAKLKTLLEGKDLKVNPKPEKNSPSQSALPPKQSNPTETTESQNP
jgi:hypothetical protein